MKVYLEKWQVKNLRDYFGENDKTQTEHWAFRVFDDALKNKQCIIDGVVLQSEQLPDGYCKWCKQTPCERLNWSHPLEDDDE